MVAGVFGVTCPECMSLARLFMLGAYPHDHRSQETVDELFDANARKRARQARRLRKGGIEDVP